MAFSMLRALVVVVLCGVVLAEQQVAPIWAWGPADSISSTGVHYEVREKGCSLLSWTACRNSFTPDKYDNACNRCILLITSRPDRPGMSWSRFFGPGEGLASSW